MELSSEHVGLITGAASGIGAAVVCALAKNGMTKFVLVDRNSRELALTAEKVQGSTCLIRCQDVRDEAAWLATIEAAKAKFSRLDFVAASAGVADAGKIDDLTFEQWRHVLSVNLDGAFLTMKYSLPLIRSGKRGGAIVLVSSASAVKAESGNAAYGVSKAALVHLAKVAAKECAADQIRINAILPGGVMTPMWKAMPFFQDLVKQHGSEVEAFSVLAKGATPLGRFATTDEVAEQIVHLFSPSNAMMTGSAILLDGGYTL